MICIKKNIFLDHTEKQALPTLSTSQMHSEKFQSERKQRTIKFVAKKAGFKCVLKFTEILEFSPHSMGDKDFYFVG
jgi:hypothetical protein